MASFSSGLNETPAQLLVRVERDAGGLLAVAEGGVEDLDHCFS